MNQLTNGLLSSVSAILFYPVLAALFLSLLWLMYQSGIFLREAWQRTRNHFTWRGVYLQTLEQTCVAADAPVMDIALEKTVQAAEASGAGRVNYVRFSIRSGPTLGLMGTLIPMAEALLGLSKGNLPALAGNSSTAFSTTVLGLAIGLIAYAITVVREKWLQADIRTISFRAEELLRAASFHTQPK